MTIVRLQHIGTVVSDLATAWEKFDRILGMRPRDFRDDQARGMQHDARVLLGNDSWIHMVRNWNPESRVYRFLADHGEGLEHIAIETDDIEAAVGRLRSRSVSIYQDRIFHANDGFEAFVYPADGIGFTVELIQPHATSWAYPKEARGLPISTILRIQRAHHVTAVVRDVKEAADRFEELFGLESVDHRILLGDSAALHLMQDPSPEPDHRGLVRIALETETLERDLEHLRRIGVPVGDGHIVHARGGVGFDIELMRSP